MASIVLSGCRRSWTRLRMASSAWQGILEVATWRSVNNVAVAAILTRTFLAGTVRGDFHYHSSRKVGQGVSREKFSSSLTSPAGPEWASHTRRLRPDTVTCSRIGRFLSLVPIPSFLRPAPYPVGAENF